MNLKLFNEELYKNSYINKCERCKSALTEGNKFRLEYELNDPTTQAHKGSVSVICRGCMEKLNAYLYSKEFFRS